MAYRSHFRLLCTVAALTLATPLAFAQGASLETATAAQKDVAQKAFLKGAAAQKKGDHEAALTAFKESYDAVASPNSHLMYARELVALGRNVEAYQSYERIIVEAEAAAKLDQKYSQAADAARKEMGELEAKLGFVTVTVKPAAGDTVRLSGRELTESELDKALPVAPGQVRVELVSAAGKETVKEVEVAAGQRVNVDLSPEGAAPPSEAGTAEGPGGGVSTDSSTWDTRTWAYVAGGVGVAGIVTFGVFGALNNGKHSKLEDECTGGVCPRDLESDRDTGRTYQTVANVGLVVGIVGLGAGTALYLMSDNKSEKQARKKPPAPRVDVAVSHRSVTVFGTF